MHSKKRFLSAWMIALINLAAICNIKNFPLLAEYGLSVVTFLALSALFFFIPVAFTSAELASSLPERGVYSWVKAAFGPKMGFLAIWMQWISNAIWYPTILTFIAATIAYAIDPLLAQNKWFIFSVILTAFWGFTFLNFFGMKVSGWISAISASFGTIIPIVLIIFLGFFWIFKGNPTQIEWNWKGIFPSLGSLNELVLLSGVLLGLGGLEMSCVHAQNVENPKKDYPLAIFFSAFLILLFSALGALSIAAIVPLEKIELASGGMEAFSFLFQALHAPWMIPVLSAITAFGALGMMSTWIVGPSRGILATAEDGDLPAIFHRVNSQNVPVTILITQGLIVTFLSSIFLFMPSVNSSYWALVALSSISYQMMYLMMFASLIVLRYKKPDLERPYQIPFGKIGLWITGIFGMMGSFFGFIFAFFPPTQFGVGKLMIFESFLIGGFLLFSFIPLWIYRHRKPSWKKNR